MQRGNAGADVHTREVNGRSHHIPSIVVSTESTMSGAASVRTPTGPMGQSEFSMSMVCLARTPGGVRMSIRRPGFAGVRRGGRSRLCATGGQGRDQCWRRRSTPPRGVG